MDEGPAFAGNAVEERRLADVGTADDDDVFELLSHVLIVCLCRAPAKRPLRGVRMLPQRGLDRSGQGVEIDRLAEDGISITLMVSAAPQFC